MIRSLIVALDEDNVIGLDGRLPWRLPLELRRFRELTMGRTVIMGRRTWESLDGGLEGRANVVVSSALPGACRSLREAWGVARWGLDPEAFVIGGASMYALAAAEVDRAYVTRVHTRVDTSAAKEVTRFPWGALESRLAQVLSRTQCPVSADNPIAWTQTVYGFGGRA